VPFKRVPRLTAFDYCGLYRYFLTICTAERAPLFVREDAVSLVLLELSRTCDVEHFAVIAYCFMPDHLHALVEGMRDDCDLRRLARVFKQRSSFQWKRRMRAGLVESPENYPFLGSLTMSVRNLLYSVQIDQRPT
jgi:REP element-mobilizing transposase RayT